MPIGQNDLARNRYEQAVELRDENPHLTFTAMAELLGYQRPSNARHAWLQGLRMLGRENEIPASRQVRVHNGRTTRTVTIPEVEGFTPLTGYTFGVEIEMVNMGQTTCAETITNAGFEAHSERYNHETRPFWKIVSDASLRGRNGTAEAVSPVLSGQNGSNELRSVMKALRDNGARTNSSCGMHVHIGVGHLTRAQQAQVILNHQVWNSAFDAYILESRISSTYAQKRTFSSAGAIAQRWTNHENSCESISQQAQGNRYYACNIASFHKYGTFEFRMHHGSLNGKNATAWIALHTAFIQASAHMRLTETPEQLADRIVAFHGPQNYDIALHIRNGYSLNRDHQIYLAKVMVEKLYSGGYIATDLREYLLERAGNVPTNATSRNA